MYHLFKRDGVGISVFLSGTNMADKCAAKILGCSYYLSKAGFRPFSRHAVLQSLLSEESLLRDENMPNCSYVFPDYAKYQSTAKITPSERLLEQYETHGTLLGHYEPYSFGFERLVELLHIKGLWTACFEGERTPEEFAAEVWKTMQAELFE